MGTCCAQNHHNDGMHEVDIAKQLEELQKEKLELKMKGKRYTQTSISKEMQ